MESRSVPGGSTSVEKWLVRVMFAAGLLFFLLQHQAVFLQADDYGYGSLTYAVSAAKNGTEWSAADLSAYLKLHYLHWGGRVLFLSLLIPALRTGVGFIQCLQATIFWLICLTCYLLLRRKKKRFCRGAAFHLRYPSDRQKSCSRWNVLVLCLLLLYLAFPAAFDGTVHSQEQACR